MFDPHQYRDQLEELGLHKAPHQEMTLMDHMFRACAILQDMKAKDEICLAGLFHAAYGTEALHNDNVDSIPDSKREQIRDMVGPVTERAIYNFSIMSYASLGKSFRKIIRPGGEPQLKDRRDGTDIPMDREEFRDILMMKLGDVLAHMPPQAGHSQSDVTAEVGDFWEMAAEYLGPEPLDTWNKVLEGKL